MGKRAWKQLLSLMGPKVWLLSCVYVGKFGSFSSVEISFNAHPSLWQTGNRKRSNEKKSEKGRENILESLAGGKRRKERRRRTFLMVCFTSKYMGIHV